MWRWDKGQLLFSFYRVKIKIVYSAKWIDRRRRLMEIKKEFEQLLNDLGVDIEATLVRLSNNAMLLERVILKFIQDDKLPDLEQAVIDWNPEVAEQVAHTLKGVSGNLGMTVLCGYCDTFVQDIRKGDGDAAVAEFALLKEEYIRIFGLIKAYAG